MRIARFEHSDAVRWGFVEDSMVFPVPVGSGSLLDALVLSTSDLASVRGDIGDPIGLGGVRLLSPVHIPRSS